MLGYDVQTGALRAMHWRRLTFDLSGPRQTAKPAGVGPLEGRVRRLLDKHLIANHAVEFVTLEPEHKGVPDSAPPLRETDAKDDGRSSLELAMLHSSTWHFA